MTILQESIYKHLKTVKKRNRIAFQKPSFLMVYFLSHTIRKISLILTTGQHSTVNPLISAHPLKRPPLISAPPKYDFFYKHPPLLSTPSNKRPLPRRGRLIEAPCPRGRLIESLPPQAKGTLLEKKTPGKCINEAR